ncbi:hypothetical protein [Metabacillus arenae]|uniref:Uncharacterized protein n=1 Tax=Metabacillus arenae TaxID=2771434 RepID=A0A926RY63_9BACI|nr:hypothetical protein [Metabacillus arenae]MBD1381721.1 hypothetical protein [Metabacillus arenae]
MDRDKFMPQSTKKTEITIQTDETYPNQRNIAGNSVDEHKNLEIANAIISGDEIKQQNENL